MAEVLKTRYIDNMDKECPHSYYPRPSMVRESYLCLNGEWEFGTGATECYDSKILVPFPPESYLSGYGKELGKDGMMYYKRTVTLPEDFMSDRLLLHFGAIDQEARVYINGVEVGKRLGGYIPFTIDITDYVDKKFELKVICKDTLDITYPYGKQTKRRGGMWYTPVSGIWQTVWLESTPKEYIESVKVTPRLDGVKLDIVGGRVKKSLYIKELDKTFSFEGDSIDIDIDDPHLWSPDDPYLYHYTLSSGIDSVDGYFALRTVGVIEWQDKKVLALNGKRYVFNGLLDQGYYPDGLFLPATADGYRDDIIMAKSLGFNMLRKHIKVEPEIFYYLCDTLGIAVFQDMINNSDYSFIRDTALPTIGIQKLGDEWLHKNPRSRKIFEDTMYEIADLLYSHPFV